MLCRNSLIQQQPGIIFILYLHKGRLNGVLQAFFLSGISHLKLQDYGILSRLFGSSIISYLPKPLSRLEDTV